MKVHPFRIVLGIGLALLSANLLTANPNFNGRWRMDPAQSTALDGWQKMDLVIAVDGSQVDVTHAMQWRSTKHEATNHLDTAKTVTLDDYFRVEQRHMAVYPAKHGVTQATTSWIDNGRTLRIEANTLVEVSQGNVPMRIYRELRVSEMGDKLTLIELHSTRNRPLVYVFDKVTSEEAAK
ncbi:hypothetical protein [Synoicihabitans lomoniglobus]|uniref:Uncharacterized protein n=1 Tax=Synoicihabitans lomoniglobus TaxID=2909285 RepID=A0AAF0I5Y9_9BACT|nr:hypothetical protein [Opitutaceae bacterium LMO-M01]WED65791.1 hypothetical protein PXH66_02885 [Opitutaceae bacterium LMO-M01]